LRLPSQASPRRAETIDGTRRAGLIDDALQQRLDHWQARIAATVSAKLGYQQASGDTVALLTRPDTDDWSLFTCLNSLRDVEPTVNLVLDDNGLDGSGQPWQYQREPATTDDTPEAEEA
jgi:hypothetical protein